MRLDRPVSRLLQHLEAS